MNTGTNPGAEELKCSFFPSEEVSGGIKEWGGGCSCVVMSGGQQESGAHLCRGEVEEPVGLHVSGRQGVEWVGSRHSLR